MKVGRLLGNQVAHRTSAGSFALCESEASATNVLSVRKRSDSNKCFICAKAKRQQQMFYLRESEASAAMFYLRESEASAAKRPVGTESITCLGDELFIFQKDCPHKCLSTRN
ncbi:hypothetical protein [Lysinibacillus xylanilyticus]|uniref:hypothetical protein n=1 Tax=Lysinibacillus xylanilyticus TaxID=582475 RepID=UPI003D0688F6